MSLAGARVLVTGATGYVGGHVSRLLAARSAIVVPFSRHTAPAFGDIRDLDAVRAATRGTDAVVHLAVSPGYRADADPRGDVEVNVIGTLNMLLAAREFGVRRVVHVSSAHVYGPKQRPVRESDRLEPESLYGASKLAAEEYARMFARAHGIDLTVLRLSALYGEAAEGEPPRNLVVRITDLALAGALITMIGEPQHALDLLHVTDAATSCVLALERDAARGRTFNIGSGRPLSLHELATTVIASASSTSLVAFEGSAPPTLPVLDIRAATRHLGTAPANDPVTGISNFVRGRRARSRVGGGPEVP